MTSVVKASGLEGTQFKEFLSRVATTLESDGFDVRSAHIAEDWGRARRLPHDGFPYDVDNLRASELVVAYLGTPPSLGVQMELGMAHAWGKRIVILQEEGIGLPYMVDGLISNKGATLIKFRSPESAVGSLIEFLHRYSPGRG